MCVTVCVCVCWGEGMLGGHITTHRFPQSRSPGASWAPPPQRACQSQRPDLQVAVVGGAFAGAGSYLTPANFTVQVCSGLA